MANVNKPAGLIPVGHLLGLDWSQRIATYYIPSGDTNAYAIGDPVASSSGLADANGVHSVTLATAGATHNIRGVIVGMGAYESGMFDPNNLNTTIIPATKTKNYYVMVVDDPYVIFEVNSNAGGTAYTAADIGKNANLAAGANNGFVSGWVLDTTGASNVSATYQLHLLGIARRQDNAFGAYCKFNVLINTHELRSAITGV